MNSDHTLFSGNPIYFESHNGKIHGRRYIPSPIAEDLRQRLGMISYDRFETLREQLQDHQAKPLKLACIYDLDLTDKIKCVGHALRSFEKPLSEMSGQSIKEIQTAGLSFFMTILERYFCIADRPQSGDLAVFG